MSPPQHDCTDTPISDEEWITNIMQMFIRYPLNLSLYEVTGIGTYLVVFGTNSGKFQVIMKYPNSKIIFRGFID